MLPVALLACTEAVAPRPDAEPETDADTDTEPTFACAGEADRTVATRFVEELEARGERVDVFAVDIEWGLSNWSITGSLDEASAIARYEAIEADPRFPEVRADLSFTGSLVEEVYHWSGKESCLEWNARMQDRTGTYLTTAIAEPLLEAFPDVEVSNYNYFAWTAEHGVPDLNGHRYYLYGDGALAGNVQSLRGRSMAPGGSRGRATVGFAHAPAIRQRRSVRSPRASSCRRPA